MRKKIAVTLAVLMLLGAVAVAGTSFADSHITKIEAYLNREIKLTWDGQTFEPMDDGERLYPIIYGGRTYLPAAYVANKAGVDVDWDDDTKTVSFDTRVMNIDLTIPYKDANDYTGSTSTDVKADLSALSFTKFDLEVDGYNDDHELEIEFELYSNGWYKAEIELELDDSEELELTGQKALDKLLPFFEDLNLTADMSQKDVVDAVMEALKDSAFFDWDYGYEEFELEVYFTNGTKIDIDIED